MSLSIFLPKLDQQTSERLSLKVQTTHNKGYRGTFKMNKHTLCFQHFIASAWETHSIKFSIICFLAKNFQTATWTIEKENNQGVH